MALNSNGSGGGSHTCGIPRNVLMFRTITCGILLHQYHRIIVHTQLPTRSTYHPPLRSGDNDVYSPSIRVSHPSLSSATVRWAQASTHDPSASELDGDEGPSFSRQFLSPVLEPVLRYISQVYGFRQLCIVIGSRIPSNSLCHCRI